MVPVKKTISVLDQTTIDKIAAGEVVERPASIVKELVENAIDADATAITVEIKEGGISFIRITDNGNGIEKEQLPMAFLRHATSKIRQLDDLLSISSLGFRGEALSSIAAVSQVEVITKTHEQFMGARYVIEGGVEKSLEDIGAPDGTTFIIRNLFYNTPARAKFLKTPATEAGYISSFIEQLALSHPHISFKYMLNGQVKLHTSGNNNLKEVIYHVYGRELTKELIEIDVHKEKENFHMHGFIGKPIISRGNRNFENYYINGRYVKSKILMKAIEEGYHTFMMQHKYPFTSLYITMPGDQVDINVHPAKMEVRFANQEEIYQWVYQTILDALRHRELIPEVAFGKETPKVKEKPEKVSVAEPFEEKRRILEHKISRQEEAVPQEKQILIPKEKIMERAEKIPELLKEYTPESSVQSQVTKEKEKIQPADSQKPRSVLRETGDYESKKAEQLELFKEKLLSPSGKQHHRIIGQVFHTYWLVEMQDSLYIIDQHAAHEKVLYERFIRAQKEQHVVSQLLSPPLIISLSLQEQEKMEQYRTVFTNLGFEIESFGGQEYSIRAVPAHLAGFTGEEFFMEILDHLDESLPSQTLELLSDKIATMACKAAVKGNRKLSTMEAEALIDELLELENPYNCPHGRPTIISMTKYELEKKFKRIV